MLDRRKCFTITGYRIILLLYLMHLLYCVERFIVLHCRFIFIYNQDYEFKYFIHKIVYYMSLYAVFYCWGMNNVHFDNMKIWVLLYLFIYYFFLNISNFENASILAYISIGVSLVSTKNELFVFCQYFFPPN